MPPETDEATADVALSGVTMHIFGPRWATGKPLWEAEITVTAHGPTLFRDVRTVFIPATNESFSLPGTVVVHAVVNHVHLRYGNDVSTVFGVRPGQKAVDTTFVLQIDPASWQSVGDRSVICREGMCLAGQFPLLPYLATVPAPLSQPLQTLFPRLNSITDLEAASSGLVLNGIVAMPNGATFNKPLPFLVEVAQPQGDGDLIVRLDPERLYPDSVDTSELSQYFADLQSRLNPRRDNQALLHWQRLVLTDPTCLPEFWWYLSPGNATTIRFAEGEWRLLFADQDLTAKDNTTRGVLDGAPTVTIAKNEVTAELGHSSNSQSKCVYSAQPSGTSWNEKWAFTDLHFGYDAVDTAARVRRTLGVPTPRRDDRDELSTSDALLGSLVGSDGLIDPPWLWAGLPQHNGWAQIPVFNITEQIIVQALPEPWVKPQQATPKSLLRGGVIYGNDRTELYSRSAGELPWNFTLLSADSVKGSWKFDTNQELKTVELTLENPQATAEGMFWLATTPPSANDALPTLDDWVNGLEPIALRTHGIRSVYPSPFEWHVPQLAFHRVPGQNSFVSAALETSTWTYRVSSVMHTGRITKNAMPPQTNGLPAGNLQLTAPIYVWLTAVANAPYFAKLEGSKPWQPGGKPRINGLSWQRHPTQPGVQTMPLTQSNVPANYPSSSRQLLPFDLPLKFAQLPADYPCFVRSQQSADTLGPQITVELPTWNLDAWTWEWQPTTHGWQVQNALPSAECRDALALAVLGLPGVVLGESGTAGIADPSKFLTRLQYRHDLPLLDQVNALADLPPEGPPGVRVIPAPLQRESYQRHWQKLAEKGVLATVDEADAVITDNGTVVVRGLAEPRLWPVQITVDLARYPGSFVFADANTPANTIVLQAETQDALRGLDGGFVEQGDNLRLTAPGTAATVTVVGGSTALMKRGTQLRDQRGLARSATTDAHSQLLITPLTQPQGDLSLLTLTQQALSLKIGPTTWNLWFKDLPAKGAGPFTFLRTDASSPARCGVNDPKATGRDLGPWNGYEFRVASTTASDKPWLSLGQLRFYPLGLEQVRLQATAAIVAEIVVLLGRLELPAWDGQTGVAQRERPLLDAVVQVTFTNGVLTDVRRAEPDWEGTPQATISPAMWPLVDRAVDTETPTLLWTDRTGSTITNLLQTHATLGPSIVVRADHLRLAVSRHGLLWQVPAATDLVFPLNGTAPPPVTFQVPTLSTQQSGVNALTLTLNLSTGLHRLAAEWVFRMGSPTALWLEAQYTDDLLAPPATPSRVTANLRHGTASPVAIDVQTGILRLDSGGLELVWQGLDKPQTDLQVLPGITLDPQKDACWGTALLSFTLKEQPASVPQVVPSGGFVSALLRCVWGTMLQDAMTQNLNADQLTDAAFNACAGNLLAEYTTTLVNTAWQTELALSGLVEVKNLVSWPSSFAVQADNKMTFDKPRGPLNHVRHTIRILLAEHRIPPVILRGSTEPNCILTFTESACWTFRAVVEHQLVPITLNDDATVGSLPTSDSRWTVSQDVRWITPKGLYNHLGSTRASFTVKAPETNLSTASWDVTERLNTFDGLEQSRFWKALNLLGPTSFPEFEDTALSKLTDALLVDATVPLFLRQRSLSSAGSTQLFPLMGSVVLSSSTSLSDFTSPLTAPGDVWQLLSVPFFGRLQGPTPKFPQAPMVEDPVTAVQRTRAATISSIVCALTHHSNTPFTIQTTRFDQHDLRQFRRLDASSVAEGWMRLQRAQAQRPAVTTGLGSAFQIVAADTPARLASSATLDSLFDPNRTSLPPQRSQTQTVRNTDNAFVWTPQAIHALQVAIDPITCPEQYPFLTFPLMLHQPDIFGNGLVRYPAATLLPTHTATALQPTSLALVPFAQLNLQALPSDKQLLLATSELLVFDAKRQRPGLAATHVIYPSATLSSIKAVEDQLREWATATHARLAADSPCAVLRVRLLFKQGERVGVQVYYLDAPVNIAPPIAPQRANALQAPPERLRQRQGQLNLAPIPQLDQLRSFELAPPLIRGAQPIRWNTRPQNAVTWPWGWSGLRMSVAYRGGERGTAGTLLPVVKAGERYTAEHRLWWQAITAQVQFAIPTDRDFLPPYFRAPAIPGYLPAAPTIPWPSAESLKDHIVNHQPVLPGARHALTTGMRPGAPYAVRETVATQSLHDDTSQVSGQVILNMRAPRPVLLPPNSDTTRDRALQSWGSWFEPTQTVRVSPSPEAEFFTLDNGNAKALRLTIRRPIDADYTGMAEDTKLQQLQLATRTSDACELPATWDGWLFFDFTELAGQLTEWPVRVVLSSGNATFAYERNTTERPLIKANQAWYVPTNKKLVADWFAAHSHGQEATIVVTAVVPSIAVQDSLQTARLTVRVTKTAFPLPYANRLLTFEDPEYSRDLASTPVRTESIITLQTGQVLTVVLVADRPAYNTTGAIHFIYFFTNNENPGSITANVNFDRLAPDGTNSPIAKGLTLIPNMLPQQSGALDPRDLASIGQHNSKAPLRVGDELLLTVTLTETGVSAPKGVLMLRLPIVAKPTTPTPEAGYALLRRTRRSAPTDECRRFAWGPDATRIELLDPADLKRQLVRRRAVFVWYDTLRTNDADTTRYVLQKSTMRGSTHFPSFLPLTNEVPDGDVDQ